MTRSSGCSRGSSDAWRPWRRFRWRRTPAGLADEYRGRLWVTRHRPGVDRMASAWLIRTFIDSRARFAFADDRDAAPSDAVPDNMYGVRFTHHDGGCTFETLCAAFQVTDATVQRVAAVVHALDLDDAAVFPPEAATIESLIDGLQLAYTDDHTLLAEGMVLFDALYRAFAHQARDQPKVGEAATRSRRPSARHVAEARARNEQDGCRSGPTRTGHRRGWPLGVLRLFLRLGATGFGGPIALAGFMQRDLVDERRWISRRTISRPGARAARTRSARGAARDVPGLRYMAALSARRSSLLCFILPSFVMVWAISRRVRPLRRPSMDAGVVLRDRGGGHRNHRPQRPTS